MKDPGESNGNPVQYSCLEKSHGWRSLVGCSPWGHWELDMTERHGHSLSLFTFMNWRRKWQPTPVFLPEESQGWGSLVAAIYGVAQSWTRLKWLSSSNSNSVDNTMVLIKHLLREGIILFLQHKDLYTKEVAELETAESSWMFLDIFQRRCSMPFWDFQGPSTRSWFRMTALQIYYKPPDVKILREKNKYM